MSNEGGSFSHLELSRRRRLAGPVQHLRGHDADPRRWTPGRRRSPSRPGAGRRRRRAVEFARALAREAQRFADEIERMHAAQLADADGTDKAAGSDAA